MHTESDVFIIVIFTILSIGTVGTMIPTIILHFHFRSITDGTAHIITGVGAGETTTLHTTVITIVIVLLIMVEDIGEIATIPITIQEATLRILVTTTILAVVLTEEEALRIQQLQEIVEDDLHQEQLQETAQ
jgi:hypothetical protein